MGTQREIKLYVGFIGQLFLNMLKCIIIPMVIPSLVTAVGSMNLSLSGKVGLRAVIYYLSTTVLAVILGIILVVTIQPGKGSGTAVEGDSTKAKNVMVLQTVGLPSE